MMGQIVCNENVHSSDFINHLTCKSTGKLFMNPVQTVNGHIYEEDILIEQMCKDINNNKPVNIKKLGWIKLNPIKYMIDNLIEKFPDLEKHRYTSGSQIKPIIKYNKSVINDIIDNKQYNLLFYVTGYNLLELPESYLKDIINHNNPKLLTYIINNCIDPNVVIESKKESNCSCGTCKPDSSTIKYTLISYICTRGSELMIKTAIDQGLNLNYSDNIDNHPLVKTLNRWSISAQNMSKYMIDKGVDLFAEMVTGEYKTLLEYIINNSYEITDYALNKLTEIPDKNELITTLISKIPEYDSTKKKNLIARILSLKVPYQEPIDGANDIKTSKDKLAVKPIIDGITDASPIVDVN